MSNWVLVNGYRLNEWLNAGWTCKELWVVDKTGTALYKCSPFTFKFTVKCEADKETLMLAALQLLDHPLNFLPYVQLTV